MSDRSMKIEDLQDIDEIIEFLIKNSPDSKKKDAGFDYILILDFFPRLKDWNKRDKFTKEELEEFKNNFDYESFGIDREEATAAIKDFRSIRRVIKWIVDQMPTEHLEDIARKVLRDVYFTKGCDGKIDKFKENISRKYWET